MSGNQRAEDVVANRFPSIHRLGQRNVLVGGGVEDYSRPFRREYLTHARTITDIANIDLKPLTRHPCNHVLAHHMRSKFRDVHHNQFARMEARNLIAQLGSNRSASTCDQHGSAAEPVLKPPRIERDRIASEQVFQFDCPKSCQRRVF